MKSKSMYIVAALMVAALAFTVTRATKAQQNLSSLGAGEPVAVCDITRIMQEFSFVIKQKSGVEELTPQLEAEKQKREEEIMQIQNDMQDLKRDSPAFLERLENLDVKRAELKVWFETQNMRLQARQVRAVNYVYRVVVATIGQVAEDRGYVAVLNSGDPADTPKTVEGMTAARVLYNSPGIDITDEVVRRLNEQLNQQNR